LSSFFGVSGPTAGGVRADLIPQVQPAAVAAELELEIDEDQAFSLEEGASTALTLSAIRLTQASSFGEASLSMRTWSS